MSRLYALVLFVLGESVLASLSFGVAAVPALATFLAGSALLVRDSRLSNSLLQSPEQGRL